MDTGYISIAQSNVVMEHVPFTSDVSQLETSISFRDFRLPRMITTGYIVGNSSEYKTATIMIQRGNT